MFLALRLVWMSLLVYVAASAMAVMMGLGVCRVDPVYHPGGRLSVGHLHLLGRFRSGCDY